jgi:hypothetical protein
MTDETNTVVPEEVTTEETPVEATVETAEVISEVAVEKVD